MPLQLGVQPHTPLAPPPPHVSGAAHAAPAQHGCPLPPQVPQLPVPQAVPPGQGVHTVPPLPHAPSLVPGSHVAPSQHPVHDVGSHWHAPVTHRCPAAQLPCVHTPEQPSLAPHALPLQSGVHALLPHVLGVPPPPQVWPGAQPPQSRIPPQRPWICPHLPAQSDVLSGVHPLSTPAFPLSLIHI